MILIVHGFLSFGVYEQQSFDYWPQEAPSVTSFLVS